MYSINIKIFYNMKSFFKEFSVRKSYVSCHKLFLFSLNEQKSVASRLNICMIFRIALRKVIGAFM